MERWFSAVALGARTRQVSNEYVFRGVDGAVVHSEVRTQEQDVIEVGEESERMEAAGLTTVEHRDGWMVLSSRG